MIFGMSWRKKLRVSSRQSRNKVEGFPSVSRSRVCMSAHDYSNPRATPQKEMEKKANEERQAELKRDAEKLLKLSTELKDYVDKSNENVLSVDVIRKAEEIEKLAHNVKTKMKGDN